MQRKGSKKNSCRNLALLAAASAAALTTTRAKGQTLLNQISTGGEQVGRTSSFGGGSFVDVYGSLSSNASFAVFDFGTSSLLSPTQLVSSVDSDLTLNLFDSAFSGNAPTLNFDIYLITDTTTSLSSTTLKYVTNGASPGGPNNDGLAAPGATGGFAAGTTDFLLGSNTFTYTSTGTNGAAEGPYVISLTTAEETYIQNQLNAGSTVRIGLATTSTGNKAASFEGFSVTSPPGVVPSLTFDTTLTSVGSSDNTSVLQLVGAADGNHKSNLSSPAVLGGGAVGRVLSGQSATSANFTLSNGSSNGTDTLNYRVVQDSPGLHGTVTGNDPLAPSGNTAVTVGFSGADTTGQAGNDITGTVEFTNLNNSSDSNVVITATTHVVTTRFLDTAFSSGGTAPNVGEVLIGATASVPVTMFTTNPVGGSDYTSNSLTTQTLIANGVASGFNATTAYVSGTNTTLAILGSISPNFNQTFNSNQSGIVNFTVKALHSGSYGVYNSGTTNTLTPGTRTVSVGSQFVSFSTQGVNIQGEGLTGESDSARSYGQWSGWQAAALSTSTTSAGGTTNSATIGNADSNDAIYLPNKSLTIAAGAINYGLRAGAGVTAVAFNQDGWNQSGFSAGSVVNDTLTGTVISAHNTQTAFNTTNTSTATIGLNPTNDIAGTYTATMGVTMENVDQTNMLYDGVTTNAATGALAGIFGTTANDLGVTNLPLTGTVANTGSSTGAGTYGLRGGTLITNPAATLTGSYSQTGGTSTFSSAIGTVGTPAASVSLTGGSMTLALGPATSYTTSLTVSGPSQLDIKDNTVVVTAAASATAANAAYGWAGAIGSGYAAVGGNPTFTGAGIVSSQVALKNAAHTNSHFFAVAYAWTGDAAVATTLAPTYGNHAFVIQPALVGDTNLDGKVNFTDFLNLSASFNAPNTNWDQGNFNGGPNTNFGDFLLLSANFNQSISLDSAQFTAMDQFALSNGYSLSENADGTGFTATAVPEPASLGILGFASYGLFARRRRKRSQS